MSGATTRPRDPPRALRVLALAALALVSAGTPAATCEAETIVVRAGRVLPVSGPVIEDGAVLVRDGVIASVGRAADVPVPDGARLIDEPDAWLVPGFVDLHAHVAGTDINDMVHPLNADLSVLDTIVPGNEDLLDALAGGVTTLLFIPGSATNMSGWGAVVKTAGRTLDESIVRFPGALKIAQAGNPERRSGEIGRGRMGMNWMLREELRDARAHEDAWAAFARGETRAPPPHVARLDALRPAVRGEVPVLVHTQWLPVFESSIRILADELGLRVVLSHAEFDSYRAAPLVVERDLPVDVGPRAYHVDFDTGAIVGLAAAWHEAGVRRLSLNTDSPVVPEEELPFQAAMAVRHGLPWDVALRAITLAPAEALGIDARVGSIDPGKDADLVLWTGDPLDPRSHVRLVIAGGRVALDQRDGRRRW